ncbi:glycosyltransferase family 2 protein [Candidatus Woesearchaeota archaeon]|nr:glycosyltransferase family 2 protein [Candidatus Woesearchaeota archaeon]
MENKPEVSVVLPCLNEEATIGECIKNIKNIFKKENINGEIIVSDNGSTDNSVKIANSLNVKVVYQPLKGYGAACIKGIHAASGKFIVMADCDATYDFLEIPTLLKPLKEGYDFVIGTRFKGRIEKGAMPWTHRYIGNPFLSFIVNRFFKTNLSDVHCGFRVFTKEAFERMNLRTTGMEFASEMVISASKNKLKICEVPISYNKRKGKSKLKSFSDGWRHIRFIFMYSPTHLFLVPGLFLFLVGLVGITVLRQGPLLISGFNIDIHFMLFGSLLTLLGYHIVTIGLYARTYAITIGFEKHDNLIDFIAKYISLERGMVIGLAVFLIGLFISLKILFNWVHGGFSSMNEIRNVIFSITILIVGIQTIFSSFFLSMLLVEKDRL